MDYSSRITDASGITVGDEPPENLRLDQLGAPSSLLKDDGVLAFLALIVQLLRR